MIQEFWTDWPRGLISLYCISGKNYISLLRILSSNLKSFFGHLLQLHLIQESSRFWQVNPSGFWWHQSFFIPSCSYRSRSLFWSLTSWHPWVISRFMMKLKSWYRTYQQRCLWQVFPRIRNWHTFHEGCCTPRFLNEDL